MKAWSGRAWSPWGALISLALITGCPGPKPEEETGAGITVRGVVKTPRGHPIDGYVIVASDAAGQRLETRSLEGGLFELKEVVAPYALTVLPLGSLASHKTAMTFEGLTRADPTVVMFSSGLDPACTVTQKVMVRGQLSSPVGAGHTAKVFLMGRATKLAYLEGSQSITLAAGATTFEVEVPYRSDACVQELPMDLLYVEFDGSGVVIGSAHKALTLTGSMDSMEVVVAAPQVDKGEVVATVTPPAGVGAKVSLYAKFGRNYARLAALDVTGASGPQRFEVPRVEGLEFVIGAMAVGEVSFAYSRPVRAGESVALRLPTHPATTGPMGLADAALPTFIREPREGANLYLTLVRRDGANIWMGLSASPRITIPQLPGTAALSPTDEQNWVSALAITLAPGVDLDALLDGRMAGEPQYFSMRLSPELVAEGSRSTESIPFYLP